MRRSPLRRWFGAVAMALGLMSLQPLANSQDYPSKSVTILVAYAPGGQGDMFARMVGEKLTAQLKQTFVVDNRPGVSGTVGTKLAVQARKDGYTLFLGQTGEIVVNRVLMKDLGYDPLKDLVPVVMIGNAPLIMLAPTEAAYNNVSEFIQAARAKPGEFTYASVGAGTPGHLSAVALAVGAKLDLIHVPYKGVGPLMADLAGGRLQTFFSSASAALPQIKGGRFKALAVTTAQRMTSLPKCQPLPNPALPASATPCGAGFSRQRGHPSL